MMHGWLSNRHITLPTTHLRLHLQQKVLQHLNRKLIV